MRSEEEGRAGTLGGKTDPHGSPLAVLRAERSSAWLRSSRLGLVVIALLVGGAAGLGAVGFRWLIFGLTWLATGREQFGQQGRVPSLHLPFLGIGFFLVIPVVGGLIYGPLIRRFAPEARGHGVPEVMIAVAENGGRIRPQVSIVKALASALCIATGGSVGREGPIVQIGAAIASGLGQLVQMSESRLRMIVACGAGAGIAATFNAPLTGVFFAFELILREFSVDALLSIILSAVTADVISQAFFGSAPFFSEIPHDLALHNDANYLLVALLGILAGFVGVGFKNVLYNIEDVSDLLWGNRPEWLRPAVGGIVLGAVLLALPEMYGVGYPVMDKVLSGHDALWFVAILMVGKMFTSSLTIGIGGSGGVFAPSLFTGAMGGMAFGEIAHHIFGSAVGDPAIYGVVAMGAVFGAAAQAPLTSIASVLEMTGNFALALPVMLGVGIAAGLSKRLTYGTIYTTKLLRRGTDIERPRPQTALQLLTVTDVMQPLAPRDGGLKLHRAGEPAPGGVGRSWGAEPAEVRQPQVLFADETLENALRQLALYGPDGLPVVSADRGRVVGWITNDDVLSALAARVRVSAGEVAQGVRATERAGETPRHQPEEPPTALEGYDIVEIAADALPGAVGNRVDEINLPPGCIAVAVTDGRRTNVAGPGTVLRREQRLVLLVQKTSLYARAGAVIEGREPPAALDEDEVDSLDGPPQAVRRFFPQPDRVDSGATGPVVDGRTEEGDAE